MSVKAKGAFKVKLTPQPKDAFFGDAGLARMTIDKQFTGDLEGSSLGQMLSFMAAVKGSAGYVAIEQVTGTLKGRKGTFVLQHSSTMERGQPQQNISVVPDSGTDQLTGLSGQLVINIVEGQHYYEFDYAFAAAE